MITRSDLIQTGILVVGIIGLFIAANKKKQPPRVQPCGYFCSHITGANRLPAAPSLFIVYPEWSQMSTAVSAACTHISERPPGKAYLYRAEKCPVPERRFCVIFIQNIF